MKTILLFFLGASIGSFLGLVIDRFPEESILFPASHCNHCKRHLKAWDLIPIFSQLLTRSKCRYCHQKIPYWYAFLEINTGILVLLVEFQVLSLLQFFLILTGLVLGIYDIKHREYPLVVWGIFTFIAMLFSALNWMFFAFLALAFLAEKTNLKIGSGDFLYLATLSLFFSLHDLLWVIQIGSLLGIVAILSISKKPLPFIPFLLIGCILTLMFGG